MSIPRRILVERFSEKPVMIAAFLAGAVGSLSFALFPVLRRGLVTCSLWVPDGNTSNSINPLLRVSGGEEHFAFNSLCTTDFRLRFFRQPANLFLSGAELNKSSSDGSFFLHFWAGSRRRSFPGSDVLDFRFGYGADDCGPFRGEVPESAPNQVKPQARGRCTASSRASLLSGSFS